MRPFDKMMVAAVCALALATAFSVVLIITSQPQAHAQVRNAYYPYSVEMSVKDK